MSDNTLYCSFCGKSQYDVPKLIMGPGRISICDKCVDACTDIVEKSRFLERHATALDAEYGPRVHKRVGA